MDLLPPSLPSRVLLSITNGENPINKDPLALFIVQLVIIIILSRLIGYLLRYLKQPQVIAEVLTGILLGPSLLGRIPYYTDNIFPDHSLEIIHVVAEIGLIFFMFLIGVELDPALLKTNAKSAAIIALASMITPFGLGAALSVLLYHVYLDSSVSFSSFVLFVGVAMSITAFPVLARILTEQRMTHHKVGLIALSSAAVNDVVAWILLAIVVSIAKATSPISTLYTIIAMVAFFSFMWLVGRPILHRLNERGGKSESAKHHLVVIIFLTILVSAFLTDAIGIDAIFGGFVTGVICPKDNGFALYLTERVEDIIVILLLPLYFTYSGLRTDLGQLNTGKSWGYCILVIIIACAGKIVGSMTAAKILGNGWRESFTVGVLMNTKGLVELIVLNLGLDAGVLTQELFAIFVMMAVVTTMITSPVLHFVWIRNQEKKAASHIHDSFNVMMCVSNETTSLAMTSVAATLSTIKRRKFAVQALHVKEVTESPSSYFFSHKKMVIPRFMEVVQERARALRIPLKFKQIFAVDVAEDIDYYCRTKNFDLILIAWNEPLLESSGSKIRQVLAHTPSTVAVLVDKGAHQLVEVQKILAVYTGAPHQKDALKLARRMCRKQGVMLTLLSSVPFADIGIADNEPIDFIESEKPLQQCIAESRNYELVIVGIPREWDAHEDTIVQSNELLSRTTASVLLVHSKMEGTIKKRKKKAKFFEDDKARLYLGSELGPIGTGDHGAENGEDHDGSSGEEIELTPVMDSPKFARGDSLSTWPASQDALRGTASLDGAFARDGPARSSVSMENLRDLRGPTHGARPSMSMENLRTASGDASRAQLRESGGVAPPREESEPALSLPHTPRSPPAPIAHYESPASPSAQPTSRSREGSNAPAPRSREGSNAPAPRNAQHERTQSGNLRTSRTFEQDG